MNNISSFPTNIFYDNSVQVKFDKIRNGEIIRRISGKSVLRDANAYNSMFNTIILLPVTVYVWINFIISELHRTDLLYYKMIKIFISEQIKLECDWQNIQKVV